MPQKEIKMVKLKPIPKQNNQCERDVSFDTGLTCVRNVPEWIHYCFWTKSHLRDKNYSFIGAASKKSSNI